MTTEFSSLLVIILITGTVYLIISSIIRYFYPPGIQTPIQEEGTSLLYSVLVAVCTVAISNSMETHYPEMAWWKSLLFPILSIIPFVTIDLWINKRKKRAITKQQESNS